MTTWSWVLGGSPPAGVRQRELTAAYGRTATWRVDGQANAQFTIDGRNDEALGIVALATDLTIYRDGTKMLRSRIGPESDDIDPDRHLCQFSALDYRGMCAFRQTGPAGAVYGLPAGNPSVAGGIIALDLINTSQTLAGGNWGVTAGLGCTTGTPRDKTIDPGKPVIESITEMGHLDGGYEWEIDPDLRLNLWHPTRGVDNGVVLDYGGLVSRVRRLLDPKDFANALVVTGAQDLVPVSAVTTGIATDPRGRWETSAGYPTIINQPTLDARAPWLLDQSSTLRPTFSVTMRPGRWEGPAHIWLGDRVTLVVRSGRLNIADPYRVVEISIQPGEDGTETVTLGLLAAP